MAARAAAPAQQDERQQGGGTGSMIRQALLTMVAVQVGQAGIKYFMSGSSSSSSSSSSSAPAVPSAVEFAKVSGSPDAIVNNAATTAAAVNAGGKAASTAIPVLEPLWQQGTVFDAHLYITATGYPHVDLDNPNFPSVKFQGLTFGDWTWKHDWDTEVRLPPVCSIPSSIRELGIS